MGSGKKERLRQRQAAGTPLKVAIVTAPSSDRSGVSLARDVELVKAAALYADQIELVSLGAVMIAGAAQLASGGGQALLALMSALDDDTLRHLGGGNDLPTNWRDLLAVLSSPKALQHPGTAELARPWKATMADTQADLANTVEEMLVDSGAAELLPAIAAGLVTLSASGLTDDTAADTDAIMENWLALLRDLLVDKRTRLLLDDQVGSLAASLVREGQVQPHRLALQRASEAAVGSGLVARLPTFPGAPLDELLDLRSDLCGPLGRYRTAVVRLGAEVTAGPFDEDLPVELDDLWTSDVKPAFAEMDEGLHRHDLVKEIARSARQEVHKLLTEGAGLYIGLSQLTSMNDWLSATTGVAGVAMTAGALGYDRAADVKTEMRRRELSTSTRSIACSPDDLQVKSVRAAVEQVRIEAAGPDKLVMDAHTIQAIQQLGFKTDPLLTPKDLPTAAEVLDSIEKRLAAEIDGTGKKHPVYVSLAKRLDDLRKTKMAEAEGSIEFLKKILELAEDVTVAVKADEEDRLDDLTPALLPDANLGALTQIFKYAPAATPAIIEWLVLDIDYIVREVRFLGWQESVKGDRDNRRELHKTLHKQGPTDDAVYDRAYAYIREHY